MKQLIQRPFEIGDIVIAKKGAPYSITSAGTTWRVEDIGFDPTFTTEMMLIRAKDKPHSDLRDSDGFVVQCRFFERVAGNYENNSRIGNNYRRRCTKK